MGSWLGVRAKLLMVIAVTVVAGVTTTLIVATERDGSTAPAVPSAGGTALSEAGLGGAQSNVTYEQAFRDHQISVPSTISDLRYGALSWADGYPVRAMFNLRCSSVASFVDANSLAGVNDEYDGSVRDVYTFAVERGWKATGTDARWYVRGGSASTANLQVMVKSGISTCQVFLDSLLQS